MFILISQYYLWYIVLIFYLKSVFNYKLTKHKYNAVLKNHENAMFTKQYYSIKITIKINAFYCTVLHKCTT